MPYLSTPYQGDSVWKGERDGVNSSVVLGFCFWFPTKKHRIVKWARRLMLTVHGEVFRGAVAMWSLGVFWWIQSNRHRGALCCCTAAPNHSKCFESWSHPLQLWGARNQITANLWCLYHYEPRICGAHGTPRQLEGPLSTRVHDDPRLCSRGRSHVVLWR